LFYVKNKKLKKNQPLLLRRAMNFSGFKVLALLIKEARGI